MPIENIKMRPIHAFDIMADGTATIAPDNAPVPIDGAVYRWLHIDLADGMLARWCHDNLPRQAARTLLAEKTRPRVDVDGDALLLTLRGINLNDGFEQADMVSLRLWVTPTVVVSVRRQRVFAMEDLSKQILNGDAPRNPMHLISRISGNLIGRVETVSLELEDLSDDLETHVYELDQPAPRNLAPLRRQAIKMRRHIGPMADALRELSYLKLDHIPKDQRLRLRDIASSARRSLEELSEIQDRLTALADHLDMQQAVRLERNGYRLSLAASILLPMSVLTGLLGVNLGGIPGSDNPDAFWIFTGAMVVIAIVLTLILRWARWL